MIEDVSFEILSKCSNNCVHCSSCSTFHSQDIFSLQKIQQIVSELSKLCVKRICLSGGEPFLHPDLLDIVKDIASRGIICDIYTAGVLRSGNEYSSIPKDIFSQLKSAGLHRLMFNMQAITEKNYNMIMGTMGCQKHLIESIDNAVACGIETEIHFVPMNCNIEEIDLILEFANEHNVEQVSFLKLVEHGRATNNKLSISRDNEDKLKQKLKILRNQNSKIRIGIPLDIDCMSCSCHAVRNKIYIKYDGSVYGCEAFKYIKFDGIPVSNVYNQTITDILNNSLYIKESQKLICKYTIDKRACPVQNYLARIKKEEMQNDSHD